MKQFVINDGEEEKIDYQKLENGLKTANIEENSIFDINKSLLSLCGIKNNNIKNNIYNYLQQLKNFNTHFWQK